MPFEDAKDYRFNPFDLTKVWPHSDYPLHEVGKLTLKRNPSDFHTEIEQAAFEPNSFVPGIGPSPDRMLLARLISYADAHRARLGVNYKQIPVHSHGKGGAMRVQNVSDPVDAPNSKGGPAADAERYPESALWSASGDFVRCAQELHKEEDDFGQSGTLKRESWTGKAVTYHPFHTAWKINPGHDLTKACIKTFQTIFRKDPEPDYWDFSTNAVTPVAMGIPTIGFGPGEYKLAHMVNENCETRQISDACKFYSAVMERL